MAEKYNRTPNYTCDCGKEIYVRPFFLKRSKSGKAFCSNECYGKHCRKPVKCPICNVDILGGLNKKTCSRACSNKYREVIDRGKIGRPIKDKVKTARLLRQRILQTREEKCEECGYNRFPEAIHVHHIIERCKGGTDDLDNLKLLCPTCHVETHILMKRNRK